MSRQQQVRAAAWAGLAMLPLTLAVLPLTGSFPQLYPVWSWSAETVNHWFADNRTGVFALNLATTFGFALLVWFAAGLTEALRRPGAGTDVLARLITPCAVAVAVIYSVATGVCTALVVNSSGADPVSVALARFGLQILVSVVYTLMPFVALMLTAAGTAMLHSDVLPRWLAWSAFPIALFHGAATFLPLVDSGWLAPFELASVSPWVLFFGWAVAVSVALLRIPFTEHDAVGHASLPSESPGVLR